MAKINIITPPFSRYRFSGGIWCILEYAHGLASRGHNVTIIPIHSSTFPEWFPKHVGTIVLNPTGVLLKDAARYACQLFSRIIMSPGHLPKEAVRRLGDQLCMIRPAIFSYPVRLGIVDAYVMKVAPDAEINIATSFETARPVSLLSGRKFYFAQHFEPYFKNEFPYPAYTEEVALQSYRLGLRMIANSSWLRDMLCCEIKDQLVELCPNAIDHSVFSGEAKASSDKNKVIVISYGGRDAIWKGFREMAEAVAIARLGMPEYEIEWRVYGDAVLPPVNDVARYVPLGFLAPKQLAEEYRKADILLSASWYESFPLFPLEAMACGLAVITTQLGTEEYARHGVTAEIVQPKSPQSIADGISHLIRDTVYRYLVALQGHRVSKQFTWERSISRLEDILFESST